MGRRHLKPWKPSAVLTAALAVAFLPTGLAAQWTQAAPGKVWWKTAFYSQVTDQRYDFEGKKSTWLGNGKSNAKAVYTDLIVGLTGNLDFWLQVPFFRLEFTADAVDTTSVGFGDIRGWFRWRVFNLFNGSTPVSLRAGAKAPIGSNTVDAQVIPLGEGQWDVEVFGEIGHSFWPFPGYAELWLGYRFRFENTENLINPGGEFTYLAEAGVMPGNRSLFKMTLDGFEGGRLIQEGFLTATSRHITILQFAGAYRLGPIWPEIGIRLPLRGQEFPAGSQFYFAASAQLNE